jgi:hypothetical protein
VAYTVSPWEAWHQSNLDTKRNAFLHDRVQSVMQLAVLQITLSALPT